MHADFIDLDITDVAHGGVFVGRHEGRVVFVPDAIPGERVRVRLTDAGASGDTRSFWRGEAIEILDASPHRRPHVWRAADVDVAPEERPGGADFGHIRLEHQRELKAQRPLGRADAHRQARPPGVAGRAGRGVPDGTGWRTRVSLHVDDEGRIGPFAARSHRVIPVEDLPARDSLRSPRRRGGSTSARPGRIDLVQPADGRVRVIPRPETPRPPRRPAGRRARARIARRSRRSRTRLPTRSSSRRSPAAPSGSTPAASGRCIALPRRRSPSSWRTSSERQVRWIRMPGTSTSTAAWGSSPRRWASSADPPRG